MDRHADSLPARGPRTGGFGSRMARLGVDRSRHRPAAFANLATYDRRVAAERRGPATLCDSAAARSIEFLLNSPNFLTPGRRRFRHRLGGVDEHWSDEENQSSVRYGALPPGDYKFRVMPRERSEDWTGQEAALRFTIVPRWWEMEMGMPPCKEDQESARANHPGVRLLTLWPPRVTAWKSRGF